MASVTLSNFSGQFERDNDMIGKMDPYFVIYKNGQQIYRSATHNNGGKMPRWADSTTIQVTGGEVFEFRVYDNDTGLDDTIGTATVPGAQLLQPGQKTIPVQSSRNRGILNFFTQSVGGFGGGYQQGGYQQGGYGGAYQQGGFQQGGYQQGGYGGAYQQGGFGGYGARPY